MFRRQRRFPLIETAAALCVAAAVWLLASPAAAAPAAAPPAAPARDGLQNRSFEGSLNPWKTWAVVHDGDCAYSDVQFTIITLFGDDQLHVNDGHDAVRLSIDNNPEAAYWAGLYQHVSNIKPGTIFEFSVLGQMDANPGTDTTPSNLAGSPDLRAGIDPTGGTAPTSENVVWGPSESRYDSYYRLAVTTTALSDNITVFVSAHPSVCQHDNFAYFDYAELDEVGSGPVPTSTTAASATVAATQAPSAAPTDTSPPQPVATRAPLLTPTPGPDGSIVYTVQSGDTLTAIAFAAGLTVQELQDLNNLSDTNIIIGQTLLLATPAPPATASPVPTDTAPPPTAAPPTPTVTPTPADTTGQICVAMFEDENGDGHHDPDEAYLAGGTLELSGSNGQGVLADYQTNGVDEPYCFKKLEPATYLVKATGPEHYTLTKDTQIGVLLPPQGQMALEFGARQESGSNFGTLAAIGGAILVLGGGAGGFALYRRRRAK
jgi:LysM repeat protein